MPENEREPRMLVVVAHPDDETFGAGALIAHCARQGVGVHIICATRGEAGEIMPGVDATPETLGTVREAELRAACEVLGAQGVDVLGYRDSGMAGTPDNERPDAFINTSVDKVASQVARIARRVMPEVVIAMEPGGGYGHPDHIHATEAALRAFDLAGDPGFQPEGFGEPYSPARLYYFGFPRSVMREAFARLREINPESGLLQADPDSIGMPDEDVTTEVDTGGSADIQRRAAAEHRSQMSPLDLMPSDLADRFYAVSYLHRARPEWAGGERETSLFPGAMPRAGS